MLTTWNLAAVTPVTDEREYDDSRSDTTAGDREIELKGDQFEDMTDSKIKLNSFDLWALGITTALGGHFYLWNFSLSIGMGSLIIATFIVGSGYICLILCMAELSGALPFAGGTYGITRVTLGSLPGFLVACFDSYQSMFYTMLCVLVMGILIQQSTDTDEKWAPLWWFLIYASYIIIHTIGGKWYWRTMKTLSLGSFALLVVYLLGSIRFANLSEYAPLEVSDKQHPVAYAWFHGTALEFFQALPIACWFFLGVESLNLASHDAVDPKRDVPRAYVSSITTLCCTSFCTILVACSIPPGINVVQYMLSPLSFGYMLMFDIDLKRAIWLSMPGIYTSGFGFTYYYSSQVRAMGRSGLANSWLGYDVPYFNTPLPALLFGAVIGYAVGLRYHFYPALKHESIFGIGLLGAMLTYFSQFISFVAFRWYYPTIKRQFISPLGIAGAIYGTLVFAIVFITIAFLEESIGIIAFAIYVALLLIYYYLVVLKRQTFSEEEKTVLFKAYLMKSNRLKAGRVRVARARNRATAAAAARNNSSTEPNTVGSSIGISVLELSTGRYPYNASISNGSSRQNSQKFDRSSLYQASSSTHCLNALNTTTISEPPSQPQASITADEFSNINDDRIQKQKKSLTIDTKEPVSRSVRRSSERTVSIRFHTDTKEQQDRDKYIPLQGTESSEVDSPCNTEYIGEGGRRRSGDGRSVDEEPIGGEVTAATGSGTGSGSTEGEGDVDTIQNAFTATATTTTTTAAVAPSTIAYASPSTAEGELTPPTVKYNTLTEEDSNKNVPLTTSEESRTISLTTSEEPRNVPLTTSEEPRNVLLTTSEEPRNVPLTTSEEPRNVLLTTSEEPRNVPLTTSEESRTISLTTLEDSRNVLQESELNQDNEAYSCLEPSASSSLDIV